MIVQAIKRSALQKYLPPYLRYIPALSPPRSIPCRLLKDTHAYSRYGSRFSDHKVAVCLDCFSTSSLMFCRCHRLVSPLASARLPLRQLRFNHATPRRPYKIEVGVSFAGKPPLKSQGQPKRKTIAFPDDHPIAQWRNEQLKVSAEAKRLRIDSAGEDFFYIQKSTNNSGFSLGVSDGVGGWSDDGVDPSLFSQALMHFASKHASTSWAGEPDFDPIVETTSPAKLSLSPKNIVSNAYQDVLNEPAVQCGSSTACIINIDAQTGRLAAANLGDSSFSIIRSSSILHEQKPQTHYFNCPRQLAKLLPSHRPHLRIQDLPEHADVFSAQLRHDDLVVLSTDGLGDNVHPGEMIGLAALMGRRAASKPNQNLAQILADGLVEYAIACMHSQEKVSPFELAARKEGMEYEGGKVDELVLSQVYPKSDSCDISAVSRSW
ncbi:hypothetical protein FRC08_002731 [Ceratobasidium sp. 394]|nr:hypothetical protein FRC08_002731 [Ceratobasidium sp. 394]